LEVQLKRHKLNAQGVHEIRGLAWSGRGTISAPCPLIGPAMLPADQVYSVVACVLHLGGIIGENDVMDAKTLLQVEMPNRDGFVRDPRPEVGK